MLTEVESRFRARPALVGPALPLSLSPFPAPHSPHPTFGSQSLRHSSVDSVHAGHPCPRQPHSSRSPCDLRGLVRSTDAAPPSGRSPGMERKAQGPGGVTPCAHPSPPLLLLLPRTVPGSSGRDGALGVPPGDTVVQPSPPAHGQDNSKPKQSSPPARASWVKMPGLPRPVQPPTVVPCPSAAAPPRHLPSSRAQGCVETRVFEEPEHPPESVGFQPRAPGCCSASPPDRRELKRKPGVSVDVGGASPSCGDAHGELGGAGSWGCCHRNEVQSPFPEVIL